MEGSMQKRSQAVAPTAKRADGRSVTAWVFAFAEEKAHRLIFGLPRGRLLLVAVGLVALGVASLSLPNVRGHNPTLALVAGGGLMLAALVLATAALASDGELTIDGLSRVVRFRLHTPWRYVAWSKPFGTFQAVRLTRVVDSHGIHNHWRIELVLDDGSFIRLGYGLVGAVRRTSADALTARVAGMMGLPVEQADKP